MHEPIILMGIVRDFQLKLEGLTTAEEQNILQK